MGLKTDVSGAGGTPEEIANAIVFIGSDKAAYIIGASLAVDGGMLAG
jgi:NAD(P)-dependent dehydrogenase (short-subunit alcohol dehydrogenase family)